MSTITALPTPPSRQRPSTFSAESDVFLAALPTFQSEANALALEVDADATTASTQAGIATTKAGEAADSAIAALASENHASSFVAAAAAAAGATVWVPGTTYTVGDARFSLVDFMTYRRKTAGAGTVDPRLDTVNWSAIVPPNITVSGTLSLYVTQSTTLTITNYDSATTYSVEVTAGTASITGDTITYTAGAAAGSVTLTITAGAATRDIAITVQAAGIEQPTNTSPVNAATGQPDGVVLSASAFLWAGIITTHLNSDWQVATDSGFTTIVASSSADATNKTSWAATGLVVNTTYYWRVRYRGATTAVSAYSATFSFQTAASFNAYIATPTATPAAFGDAFEGGFYTGMIWNELVQSATSVAIGTGSKTFTVADMTASPLVYSGQALEIRSRANPANKMIGTVTGALGTSLTINVTSVGGSGTFTDWSIMAKYRVIVAPKASGESTSKTYKVDNTAAPTACQTLAEGYKATLAMVAAGDATMYPAAWFCKNLNIGAKTDWYLPARDELELCWRNLKPTADANYVTADRPNSAINYTNLGSLDDTVITHGTNNNSSPTGAAYIAGTPAQVAAGKNFRTSESEAFAYGSYYYWSASEYSASSSWGQGWGSSVPGFQDGDGKNIAYYVRAVRRSII